MGPTSTLAAEPVAFAAPRHSAPKTYHPSVERHSAPAALPAQKSAADERDLTTSVGKALKLLDAFGYRGTAKSTGTDQTGVGVSELARRANLPKSTAFRLLAHLEQNGYVERIGTSYRLSWHLFELGNVAQQRTPLDLRRIAGPYLGELYRATGHVTQLAVLDGSDVVYVEKLRGQRAVTLPTAVGARMPATCVALGKAMLAFSERSVVTRVMAAGPSRRTPYSIVEPGALSRELTRVRTGGFALDREEAALGAACVAAPVLVDGLAIAALSVSVPTVRFNPATLVPLVRAAAGHIAAEYASMELS